MVMKFIVSLLLGRKKRYMKMLKIRKRNVLVTIEEYIPANVSIQKSPELILNKATGLYERKTEHS